MYDLYSRADAMPRYSTNEFMPWELQLSAFNYIVDQIPGDYIVCADNISHWASPYFNSIEEEKINVGSFMYVSINPRMDAEFD